MSLPSAKNSLRPFFAFAIITAIAFLGTAVSPNKAQADESVTTNGLTYAFTNVVQKCKTKIDKRTNTPYMLCSLSVEFTVTNTGSETSSKDTVLLWAEQGSVFDAGVGPFPLGRMVKALKPGKSFHTKAQGKFDSNQSGTFIFATTTNYDVLVSIEVP